MSKYDSFSEKFHPSIRFGRILYYFLSSFNQDNLYYIAYLIFICICMIYISILVHFSEIQLYTGTLLPIRRFIIAFLYVTALVHLLLTRLCIVTPLTHLTVHLYTSYSSDYALVHLLLTRQCIGTPLTHPIVHWYTSYSHDCALAHLLPVRPCHGLSRTDIHSAIRLIVKDCSSVFLDCFCHPYSDNVF